MLFWKHDDKYSFPLGSTLSDIFLADLKRPEDDNSVSGEILATLNTQSDEEKCIAVFGMMGYAFRLNRQHEKVEDPNSNFEEIFNRLLDLLKTNKHYFVFSVSWCIAWAGECKIFPDKLRYGFVVHLIGLWVMRNEFSLQRAITWALCKILIPSLPNKEISEIPNLKATIQDSFHKPANEYDKLVAIYLIAILKENFDIGEVTEVFKLKLKRSGENLSLDNSFGLFAKSLNLNLKEP